jgi:hypothetical protein
MGGNGICIVIDICQNISKMLIFPIGVKKYQRNALGGNKKYGERLTCCAQWLDYRLCLAGCL